jgi:hypothetical protein
MSSRCLGDDRLDINSTGDSKAMSDNNIDGATLRVITGTRKTDWVGTSIQLAPDLRERLDTISKEHEVPLNSVIVLACERLLEASAA